LSGIQAMKGADAHLDFNVHNLINRGGTGT